MALPSRGHILPRTAVQRGLRSMDLEPVSDSRITAALGMDWRPANSVALPHAQSVLLDDPHRFGGVAVLDVDEHVRHRTKRGNRYVIVIIDPASLRDARGPAQLPDVTEGWSEDVLKTWLTLHDQAWREQVEVGAMDGFAGSKSAVGEQLLAAWAVTAHLHVVSPAGGKRDECRRIQRGTMEHRSRRSDPLYWGRYALRTGADLLTDTQAQRHENLFADERHALIKATGSVYQRMIQVHGADHSAQEGT